MNIYNIKKDDLFKNKTNDVGFNEPLNEYGIYDENNYSNIRPIFQDYLEDYKIEQTKGDFNREILLQRKKEQNEIVKNIGEISIVRDPRITKYEDTYSMTPYATFMITPLSQMDGEDIVSRFDQCYGSWITRKKDRCNSGEPCSKIKQHFRINNPDYTGEHCRDDDGRRVRQGDTRQWNCNDECNPMCKLLPGGNSDWAAKDSCICPSALNIQVDQDNHQLTRCIKPI